MVKGLAKFREHFRSFSGQYMLIGGAACDLLNDVFRLYRIIDPSFKTDIPKDIRADMKDFLDAMESEGVDLKNLGIKGQNLGYILNELRRLYVHD